MKKNKCCELDFFGQFSTHINCSNHTHFFFREIEKINRIFRMVVERKWSADEIAKDDVSKKDIIAFLHGEILFPQVLSNFRLGCFSATGQNFMVFDFLF